MGEFFADDRLKEPSPLHCLVVGSCGLATRFLEPDIERGRVARETADGGGVTATDTFATCGKPVSVRDFRGLCHDKRFTHNGFLLG